MHVILKFGAIEILINTGLRDLRIRYQNFDKNLTISVCKVVIIILISVKLQCKKYFSFHFNYQAFDNSIN